MQAIWDPSLISDPLDVSNKNISGTNISIDKNKYVECCSVNNVQLNEFNVYRNGSKHIVLVIGY